MTTTLSAPAAASRVDASELRVARVRPLRGPNYWRLAPVIACDVRLGTLEQRSTAELPGFTERLLATLPTLREHPCSRGSVGGFVERLAILSDLGKQLHERQADLGSERPFGKSPSSHAIRSPS